MSRSRVSFPANARCWHDVGLILGQPRRWWVNIKQDCCSVLCSLGSAESRTNNKPTLVQCLVFAGICWDMPKLWTNVGVMLALTSSMLTQSDSLLFAGKVIRNTPMLLTVTLTQHQPKPTFGQRIVLVCFIRSVQTILLHITYKHGNIM